MGVRRGCLSFYYHMYGKRIGSLKVVRSSAAGRRILWARHTNEGDRWLNARIDINENSMYNVSYKIYFCSPWIVCYWFHLEITFTGTVSLGFFF